MNSIIEAMKKLNCRVDVRVVEPCEDRYPKIIYNKASDSLEIKYSEPDWRTYHKSTESGIDMILEELSNTHIGWYINNFQRDYLHGENIEDFVKTLEQSDINDPLYLVLKWKYEIPILRQIIKRPEPEVGWPL